MYLCDEKMLWKFTFKCITPWLKVTLTWASLPWIGGWKGTYPMRIWTIFLLWIRQGITLLCIECTWWLWLSWAPQLSTAGRLQYLGKCSTSWWGLRFIAAMQVHMLGKIKPYCEGHTPDYSKGQGCANTPVSWTSLLREEYLKALI